MSKLTEIQIGDRSLFTSNLSFECEMGRWIHASRKYSFTVPTKIEEWQHFTSDQEQRKGVQWVHMLGDQLDQFEYCLVAPQSWSSLGSVGLPELGTLSMELHVMPREVMGPEPLPRDSRGRWVSLHKPLQNKRTYRYDICDYLRDMRVLPGTEGCCGSCHSDEGWHSMEDFEDDYPGRLVRYIQLGICHPVHCYMKEHPLSRDQWAKLIKELRREERNVKT